MIHYMVLLDDFSKMFKSGTELVTLCITWEIKEKHSYSHCASFTSFWKFWNYWEHPFSKLTLFWILVLVWLRNHSIVISEEQLHISQSIVENDGPIDCSDLIPCRSPVLFTWWYWSVYFYIFLGHLHCGFASYYTASAVTVAATVAGDADIGWCCCYCYHCYWCRCYCCF